MTRRERVFAAINRTGTDMIPYHLSFTTQEHDVVAAYFGDPCFESKIGNHISVQWYKAKKVEIPSRPGFFVDDFGVIWDRTGAEKESGLVTGILLPEPTMKDFKFPVFDELRWRSELEELVNSDEDVFKFAAFGFALYDRAWTFRGMENLLVDMIAEPEFVEELLDGIMEYNFNIIDIALEYDIDGFHFADDWGSQKGLVMGPKLWQKFIKPRTIKMYERIKSKGKIISQHSCGDVYEIFPDLVEMGLDIYQTLQPEVYDLRQVKQEFGKDLTFWGGISTQRLLPFGTPEEVKETVRETLKIMGENGGYIAGPTHNIVDGTPPENVAAMLEVLQNG